MTRFLLSSAPSGGVAQLVRALPCHGRGYGFEPRRSRHLFPSISLRNQRFSSLRCRAGSQICQLSANRPDNVNFLGSSVRRKSVPCQPSQVEPQHTKVPNRATALLSLWFLEFRSYLDARIDELTADRVVAMDGY